MPKHRIKKALTFVIREDVFKTSTLFVLNCCQETFIKKMKRYGLELDMSKYSIGTVVPGGKGKFFRIVWVEKVGWKPDQISNLVHEVTHLVVRICQDKGVPIRANIETGECGDETMAYLTGFYITRCLKMI